MYGKAVERRFCDCVSTKIDKKLHLNMRFITFSVYMLKKCYINNNKLLHKTRKCIDRISLCHYAPLPGSSIYEETFFNGRESVELGDRSIPVIQK